MSLTPRQAQFVSEYLKDLNGTQAAIRAGYSEKGARTEATRLLANADIAVAIEAAMSQRAERTQVTQDSVVRELRDIGFAQVQEDEYESDGSTGRLVLKRGALRYEHKLKALELLGKHLGIFKERVEHTGPEGGPLVVEVRKYVEGEE